MTINDLKTKVYYAQNREDLILEAFFPDKKSGFYVDVGAYDPDYDSVTKRFYQKGWRGINIEPQENRYKKFVRLRPKDININAGVGAENGALQLRSYRNNGLSTFSPELRAEYLKNSSIDTDSYVDIETKVYTLATLFKKHRVGDIDFLKIDVEGFEYEVLQGNDWELYRPKVICLESNHIVKDWKEYIKEKKYRCVFFDGLNEYYVDSKQAKVRETFNYVDHIIMKRGGGIAFGDYKYIKQLQRTLNGKIVEIDTLRQQVEEESAKIDGLRKAINTLERTLNSPSALVKILIKRVLGLKI